MVEEECAKLVVDVGDGLSVATVSCLMWGELLGRRRESNEEGAHHFAEDRKGKVIIPFVEKRALTMFKFNVLWLLCTSKDNAHVMVSGHTRFAKSHQLQNPLMEKRTGGEGTKVPGNR